MITKRPALLLWLPFAFGACAEPSAPSASGEGVASHARAVADDYPALGFEPKPDYLPENVLVLTFDDGPDWNNTAKVLDVLAQKHVKASFFINTVNWSDVNQDAPMQDLVKRMVDEGHELANHTVHHLHLPTLSASAIEDEIGGVEETVGNIMGSAAPRITLLRAPFGEPYQDGNGYDLVAPIVAEHAVHIGWAIDTFDYNCPEGDGACVFNNFKSKVKTPGQGDYGIVLMHSVHSQTAAALPDIIDYALDNGFELWTVEQAVCAAFGSTSDHIVDGSEGGCNVTPADDAGPVDEIDGGVDPGDPDAGPAGQEPDADTGGGDDDDDQGAMGGTSGGCGCQVGGHGEGGSTDGAGVLLVALLAALGYAVAGFMRRRTPRTSKLSTTSKAPITTA